MFLHSKCLFKGQKIVYYIYFTNENISSNDINLDLQSVNLFNFLGVLLLKQWKELQKFSTDQNPMYFIQVHAISKKFS